MLWPAAIWTGGLAGDQLVVDVPGPFPGLAVGVGLAELPAEVVEGAGKLFLDIHAVEHAGLAGGVGGGPGPDFLDVAEHGVDGATDRTAAVGAADLRADFAGEPAEFVVKAIAVANRSVGGDGVDPGGAALPVVLGDLDRAALGLAGDLGQGGLLQPPRAEQSKP